MQTFIKGDFLQDREIKEFFKDLKFEESTHTYTFNNQKLKSVSYFIKDYTEYFDEVSIAINYAKKHNLILCEVLNQWREKKDNSCALGTKVHLFGENYILKNKKYKEPENGYEEAIVKFWNDLPEYIISACLELQMYNPKWNLAGTSDIILYNTKTNTYIIADYKTNIDLFKNFKGKTLLEPFNDLLDCSFSKYEIQLSTYQLLFEQTGLKISSRKIIWLKPNGEYELYDTRDLTKKIKNILNKNEKNT